MLYPDKLPYMYTTTKKAFLPIGSPIGKGNLVFLFSKSIDQSIKMISNPDNFSGNNKYYWYYYNLSYFGKIGTRMYRVRDRKEQKTIYDRVVKETGIHSYPVLNEIRDNEIKNMYFELSKYLNIFNEFSSKFTVTRYIRSFWLYINPIVKKSYGSYKNRYILIDANSYKDFNSAKSLREKLNNPLFLIYFTLYKNPELVKDLDIDFLIYCNTKVLKFNPSKFVNDKKLNAGLFLRELKKLYSVAKLSIENIDESELIEDTIKTNISGKIINKVIKPTEISIDVSSVSKKDDSSKILSKIAKPETIVAPISKVSKEDNAVNIKITDNEDKIKTKEKIKTKIVKKVEDATKKVKEEDNKKIEVSTAHDTADRINKEVENSINEDSELLKEIYNSMLEDRPAKSQASTARDALLREKQKEIKVKELTLEDLEKFNGKNEKIEKSDVSNALYTTNPNMKEIKFNNFTKSYIDKALNKDIVAAFESVNDKSIKMFIRNIDVKDTSDPLNYKETWTVNYEDENRLRSTVKVDIPKFIDNQFLWLGGNRKIIKNQNFFLPIVKNGANNVEIVSNYNKITISRHDTKSFRSISILDKLLRKSDNFKSQFITGNYSHSNKGFITTIEYDSFSSRFNRYSANGLDLYFSQIEAREVMEKKKIPSKGVKYFFIGTEKNEPIYIDINTQKDLKNRSITEIIFSYIDEEDRKILKTIKAPKSLIYTHAKTQEQYVPIIILLGLWEGLSTVLKKANIKFRLADSIRDMKTNESDIKFNNCYLIYENDVPTELLMNGLRVLNTVEYDISEMEKPEAYVPFISKKYGKLNILNSLNNVYEFTIGPIEKEVLSDMAMPTDLVSLMLYANNLLCDNQYVNELNTSQYRVRNAEIIPSILYEALAKAYVPYKNSNGKKKLSLPQDIVIKNLLAVKTVEDYSALNPMLELESNHSVSLKGFRGVNLPDSFTVPKRAFDKTMIGLVGPSSSPDANVGVSRSLTMEPNIETVRGYVNLDNKSEKDLKDINLFSPAELLIPLGVTRDDPTRTGHSVKQSRHTVPIKNSAPVLISNGSDEVCKYYLSSDFIITAEDDGEVVEKDQSTNIMIVRYKNGTHRAINLDKNIVKNGGGGFELSNILITDLDVGDKFKKNETLAWHKDFFKKTPYQGVRLCIGVLAKVAINSLYATYEDGTFITRKMAEDCATEMCFKKSVVIGRNSNVSQIVKVGDKIEVDEPLITFDESFEESDINKLLDSLGDNEQLKDTVISNSRNTIKSKYSGVIEEIKMYSTAELDELSDSLKHIFSKYYKKISNKKKLLEKYDNNSSIVKCGMLLNETTGKIEPNRYGVIRGEKVNDGVLIEFYIKHSEPLEVGSKIA